MASSHQSYYAYNASPLSPSKSSLPPDADQDISSPSNNVILSSLECLNDYVQKHYDRFVAQESLERSHLAASFAKKEQDYERQISTLKAVHTDIAALLAREQVTNAGLHQKLDSATSSMARLCKVVTDANFVFVGRKRAPHEVKQEENSQSNTDVLDVTICPDATISALLSQIESVVTEMNAHNSVGLPSSVDPLPCHSVSGTLRKVVDSLLATQRAFSLLRDDFKFVDATRMDGERQNESLQEKIALLQQELERARSDNEGLSQELTAARLEREKHVCRPPASAYPTPAAQDEFPSSLPSPPLEKRDFYIPDDILQEARKIGRKTSQTPPGRILPENAPLSSGTPVVETGPSSVPTSPSFGRRKVCFDDAIKRVQANPTSSSTQSGPSQLPVVRDDQQATRPSMLPPSTPIQGVKRTSSGVHKCQNVSKGPPTPLSTSESATSSISDKTKNLHRKKRRINGTSDTPTVNQKHKSTNEAPSKTANVTHTSTPTIGPTPSLSSKHPTVSFPKTNASDLKCLKFNKKSRPSGPPPVLATATSTNIPRPITTPVKSDRMSMRPLDLAKKSPEERAAMRKPK